VTAPAVDPTSGTWHDQVSDVVAAVATDLRLVSDDPDRPRLERSARAAFRMIDGRLSLQPRTGRMYYALSDVEFVTTYPSGGAPADVMLAAHQLTAELHQRPLWGISGAWSPTGEALRISREHLAGVEPLLLPYVEGWGIA